MFHIHTLDGSKAEAEICLIPNYQIHQILMELFYRLIDKGPYRKIEHL